METQKDNSIPFLDVLISRLPDGSISHQVYRKKTHTDRYLNASSHHHPTQKYVVLKTLVTRAICNSSPQFLAKEKAHLTKTLLSNGYSLSQITHAFCSTNNPKPKITSPSSPPHALISLPYIQGTTDHISKLLAKKNIKTIFKPYKTLKQLFRTAKDKSDPMLGPGVYQIPCSCGKSYIGQTGRSFKAQLKEHIVDTTYNRISKSTIVEHSHNSKHLIFFDQTKILASAPHYSSHLIWEALEIEKHPNNFPDSINVSKPHTHLHGKQL
jgi:hypothetical protein